MKVALIAGGLVLTGVLALIPLSPDLFRRAAPTPPENSATVLFVGDMFFDRYIRKVGETVGWDYPFSCIDRILFDADLAVANLEGPITDEPSVSMGTVPGDDGHFTFTFPREVAPYLARHNIGVVNLGNNHIFNFGYAGVRNTMRVLEDAGVLFMGEPRLAYSSRDMLEESSVATASTTIKGVLLSFVSYNEFDPEGSAASRERALAGLASARESGSIPVLYAHWGEEYQPPSDSMKALAREFVDAGAALVVGSHPHVVLPRESYGGAFIYYSLGNFIFDQYFNEDVRHGLLLKVLFSERGVEGIEEISIILETDGRTCVSGASPATFPPDAEGEGESAVY